MIEYALQYHEKLTKGLFEHLEMVVITLIFSVIMAAVLTLFAMLYPKLSKLFLYFFSVIYSIPSLSFFAVLIPVTGLGRTTAIIVLVLYNQYLLLRNFITGLNEVDAAIIEAARGIGMNRIQVLFKIQLPLSKSALITGIKISVVSTIGIATIAASINAGGLGSILFDGLRTMNVYKIMWGSILSAGLALIVNGALGLLRFKED